MCRPEPDRTKTDSPESGEGFFAENRRRKNRNKEKRVHR